MSRRPLVPMPEPERIEALRRMNLDADMNPLDASPLEAEANRIIKEPPMSEPTPTTAPIVKTPALADKRLWLSIATVVSLLLSKFLKIDLDPELLATIAVIVVGYITNSAVKEARVASVVAHAQK